MKQLDEHQVDAVLAREREGSGNGQRGEPTVWDGITRPAALDRWLERTDRVDGRTPVAVPDHPARPLTAEKKSARVVEEAKEIVFGDRATRYGHPRDNFRRTADLLTALLRDKLKPGASITTRDVAMIMLQVKVGRELHVASFENRVDMIGYILTSERLDEC